MRPAVSVEQMRAIDRAGVAQVGEGALIARASAALAAAAASMLGSVYGSRIVVLAGSGHNGADALRAGSLLARRGAQVLVVRSSDSTGDEHVRAALADALAAGARVVAAPPDDADLVIDGMVGVGSRRGPLEGRPAELVGLTAGMRVLAVDLPSGVDADTGAVLGSAVTAAVTVTFGALKPGLLVGAGREHCGQMVVAEIGLEVNDTNTWVMDADDAASFLRTPSDHDDKRSRGVVGVIAGSTAYPGAGLLCVGGAVRAGAGYVRAPGAPREVLTAFPSAVAAEGRADVWVVGPGVDEERWSDAQPALCGVDGIRKRTGPTIITPHAGEFERLTGIDPADDPIGSTRTAAKELGAVVVLKGATTIVAAPDASVRLVLTPTGWLATAGTGDVLAGVIGAVVAGAVKDGASTVGAIADAVAAAVFVHGVAGRIAADRGIADAAIAADDLLAALGPAMASIRSHV